MRHRRARQTALLSLAAIALCGGLLYALLKTPAEDALHALAAGHYQLAQKYFAADADRGDPAAQNSLANLYYLGLGVKQDFVRASQLYFDAARQGLADAQLNLGNLYQQGLGVNQDPMRAFAWYRVSDQHGNAMAENYLSQLTVEYTLSPLQIETVRKQWPQLEMLAAEDL